MAKLPYLQFYSGDWLKDPLLSMCSPLTRGIWIDALCAMHERDRAGELSGTPEQLARVCRCSPVEFSHAANELSASGAADVTNRNGVVTLINRRMKQEYNTRHNNNLRVQKHRGKSLETHLKRDCHNASSETETETVTKDDEDNSNLRTRAKPTASASASAKVELTEAEKAMTKDEFAQHLSREYQALGDAKRIGEITADCLTWYKTNRSKPPTRLHVKQWLSDEREKYGGDFGEIPAAGAAEKTGESQNKLEQRLTAQREQAKDFYKNGKRANPEQS